MADILDGEQLKRNILSDIGVELTEGSTGTLSAKHSPTSGGPSVDTTTRKARCRW